MEIKSLSISPTRVLHSLYAAAVVLALTLVMDLIGPVMLGQGVIALLYLVPCGWYTLKWGRLAGVSAALTSALCFDFFFIPPYGTFTIGSLEGWLLLLLFIAASILVVGRYQTLFGEEQKRERKATFLYEIVASIANQQTREGIAGAIASQMQQIYQAELVQVNLSSRGNSPAVVKCVPLLPDCRASRKPERALGIVSGPALIGEIAIWKGLVPLPAADDPMLQAILRQTAAALDRVQGMERGNLPHPQPFSRGEKGAEHTPLGEGRRITSIPGGDLTPCPFPEGKGSRYPAHIREGELVAPPLPSGEGPGVREGT